MSETIDVEIFSKFDYELSGGETKKIFSVYNECFYNNSVTSNKQMKLAYEWIRKSHIWKWYIARVGSQIVGIAAYCYDYKNASNFEIRPDKGENICSVGVLEKYRGNGIGKLLMRSIIKEHGEKDLTVEIKRENDNYVMLMEFYQKLGFEIVPDDDNIETDSYLTRKAKTLED